MNDHISTQDVANCKENLPQGDTLNDILGKILSSSTTAPQQPFNTATDTHNAAQASTQKGNSPDIISSLLSNPELLSKLPSIISAVKPMIDMLGRGQTSIEAGIPQASSNGKISDQTAAAFAPHNVHKKEIDHRADLLCAMKPYLNQDRQSAIDYIIKLSRLGDILKTL